MSTLGGASLNTKDMQQSFAHSQLIALINKGLIGTLETSCELCLVTHDLGQKTP